MISFKNKKVLRVICTYAERFPECPQAAFEISAALFALVASAHTFIAGLTAVAIIARFHLNAGQRAAVLIVAVIMAARNAAANTGVCILTIHNVSPQKTNYRFRRNTFCPRTAKIMRLRHRQSRFVSADIQSQRQAAHRFRHFRKHRIRNPDRFR